MDIHLELGHRAHNKTRKQKHTVVSTTKLTALTNASSLDLVEDNQTLSNLYTLSVKDCRVDETSTCCLVSLLTS